jgi:hypothetical protein
MFGRKSIDQHRKGKTIGMIVDRRRAFGGWRGGSIARSRQVAARYNARADAQSRPLRTVRSPPAPEGAQRQSST